MALPIQSAPTFFCELPSDGTEVKFRPFLVKEQRNLLLTKEDPSPKEVLQSVKTLVEVCTFGKVNTTTIPMFDLEYLFLQIRSKVSWRDSKNKHPLSDRFKPSINRGYY